MNLLSWNYYKCNCTAASWRQFVMANSWVRPKKSLVSAEVLAAICTEAFLLCYTVEDPAG